MGDQDDAQQQQVVEGQQDEVDDQAEIVVEYMDIDEETDNFKEVKIKCMKKCRERLKVMYSFQPLRLIRCDYKPIHDVGEYPLPRSGHRVIASESHLYSLGGYNPNREENETRRDDCMIFQELWSFNFAARRWKLLLDADNSEMPRELASNALAIYNNVLISHGGTGYPFSETCSNDCYVYTTGERPRVMRLNATGDLPTAQFGQGIVIHNNYLYTIGGTTGYDFSCEVYRLNLLTMVWENVYTCRPGIHDDPEGRYRHEVAFDGHHIYLLGGADAYNVYALHCLPAFNIETSRWDYIDTLADPTAASADDPGYPKARTCLSCVQHTCANGDIEAFITGGFQGDLIPYFNDIWKLNLRTKQWYKIHTDTLPRPLYFHSAAHAGNGCMYIFGGIEYTRGKIRCSELYKMWMTIPKLSDICWDAITHYNDRLHHFDHSTLLQAGIPERYVKLLP